MDIDKILERRKTLAKEMTEQGFSYYDIARFFEISPCIVKEMLGDKYVDYSAEHGDSIVFFMKERNEQYQKMPEEQFNEEYGFLQFRNTMNMGIDIQNPFTPRKLDKDYLFKKGYIEGLHEPVTSTKRGDRFRRFNKYFSLYLELYANGWSGKEIKIYTSHGKKKSDKDESDINEPKMYQYLVKKCDPEFKRHADEKFILEVFKAGYNSKEACILTGINPYGSSKENRDNIVSFRDKHGLKGKNPDKKPQIRYDKIKEEEGRQLFKEWKELGLKQKEIAKNHNRDQSYVSRIISYYRKLHNL